jgi:hypothetical protein
MPFGTFEHVPSVPATRTNGTCRAGRQAADALFAETRVALRRGRAGRAGWSRPQLPLLHVFGDAQSAVVPQVMRHAPPVPHA